MEHEELDLFPLTEEEKRDARITKIESKLGNLQRGIFARHNELHTMYSDLFNMYHETKNELDSLKKFWGRSNEDTEIHKSSSAAKVLAFYQ